MIFENCYNAILEGYEAPYGDESAIDFARGMVWSEVETSDESIGYGRYVDTVDGIDIYYDYGADYYFFADAEPEER